MANTAPEIPPTVVPAALAPAPTEPKVTPIVGPLAKLAGSQKAVVVVLLLAGTGVLVGIGRISWEQAQAFATPIVIAWLGAHAGQEGLGSIGKALAAWLAKKDEVVQ